MLPSMTFMLFPQPGSAALTPGPPHHPPKKPDIAWTLSRKQCRRAGRQAVGGALQKAKACLCQLQRSQPLGGPFFSPTKLGRYPPSFCRSPYHHNHQRPEKNGEGSLSAITRTWLEFCEFEPVFFHLKPLFSHL